MKGGIDIRDLNGLKALKIVLQQTSQRGLALLPSLDNTLKKELEDLKKIERQRQRAVNQCQARLQSAHAALSRCQNSGYYDDNGSYEAPNCRHLEHYVADCHRQFQAAQRAYQECKNIVAGVQAAIKAFNKIKYQFKYLLQEHTPPASHALQQLINGAENYKSIQAPTRQVSNPAGATFSQKISQQSDGNLLGELLTAVTGVAALALLAHEIFTTSFGEIYKLFCSSESNRIDFHAQQNDNAQKAARLTIQEQAGKRIGKILNFNIQNTELREKILNNIEQTAIQNQCSELGAWANQHQLSFFQSHHYHTRNNTPIGAEVYKTLP